MFQHIHKEMVPYAFTLGVVIHTTWQLPTLDAKTIRDALIASLPAGTGVGEVTVVMRDDDPQIIQEAI